MSAPKWASGVLRRLAGPADADILVGDLEEAHRARVERRGAFIATLLTAFETADIAAMLLRRRLRVPAARLSWLDVRLAVRMLARYPGLSLVSTVSLALGVAIGSSAFAAITMLAWPSMPLPDGDRIVSIRMHDDASNRYETRLTADFLRWRAGTNTLADVGAGWDDEQNLTMGDGTTASVYTAAVTASTFTLARVKPVVGRLLSDEDARPAAPSVIVIGQKLWREHFASDPAVVGRELMLGDAPVTVVGVAPEGFGFPRVAEAWEPLRLDEAGASPRSGIGIAVWARLKPGATIESAERDLTVMAERAAVEWPATHARLKPEVRLYTRAFLGSDAGNLMGVSLNLVVFLLIAVVVGNVALLMFARAATRESEIIVRSALGASRGRIVAQFLAESFVLSAFAFAVGMVLARWGLRYGFELVAAANGGRPFSFWLRPVLPSVSIVYGIGLSLFAAIVAGVLPGLKVTRGLASRLRESAAGAGGLKFGGVWTVLIVAQVALTMAVPLTMYFVRAGQGQMEAFDIGVPQTEYLLAQVSAGPRMSNARFVRAVRTIREALPAISGVSTATIAGDVPLIAHGHAIVAVDDGGAAPPDDGDGHRVAVAAVDPDFFNHFAMPPIAGRLFADSDYIGRPRVVVVNQLFVDRVLGGRNPVGRRVKWEGTWLEIIGLVRDVSMGYPGSAWKQGLYVPLDLSRVNSVFMTARVPGAGPGGLTAQASALREIASKTDPALRVARVESLADELAISVNETGFWVKILTVVSAWVMSLALTGIYAVMSFAVSRRTREIGIRVALGSSRPRVVLAILRRPILQVTAGMITGTPIGLAFGHMVSGGPLHPLAIAGYFVLIVGVCVLACVVPARRALNVDPIAALRND